MNEIDPRVRFQITARAKEGWHEPSRLLYDCELVHVEKGEFQLRIGNSEMTMRTGAVAIIGPKAEHESWVLPGRVTIRQCLHFDWNAEYSHLDSPLFCMGSDVFDEGCIHPVEPAFLPCINWMYPPRLVEPIRPILRDVFARLDKGDAVGETLMYPVLTYLLQKRTQQQPRRIGSKGDRAISALKHYIDVHYREALTLEQLCARARLSPSHLCLAFRRYIGMPPNKYLNHVRLEHACRLLLAGDMNVSEVGRSVGFRDNNYFARFFKQKKGVSPGVFLHQQGR